MEYDVDLKHSILGGSSSLGFDDYTGDIIFRQAALVAVKDEHNPYGLRVFLGCSGEKSEREICQSVAGYGDEVPYELIKSLYLEMTKNKEENEKSHP